MNDNDPPPEGGTKHDGDPLFEALVFGWTCSADEFHGETMNAPDARARLADYFEQYLEQWTPAVGDRVMRSTDVGWVHGEVTATDAANDRVSVRWDLMPRSYRSGSYTHAIRKLVPEPRPAAQQ